MQEATVSYHRQIDHKKWRWIATILQNSVYIDSWLIYDKKMRTKHIFVVK